MSLLERRCLLVFVFFYCAICLLLLKTVKMHLLLYNLLSTITSYTYAPKKEKDTKKTLKDSINQTNIHMCISSIQT